MPDWYLEEGIGEHRAILVNSGHIIAARIDWPGTLTAGQIGDAVLVARAAGSPRGTVRFASGEEALIDNLPRNASEGSAVRIEIVRAPIAEGGRLKLARGRITTKPPSAAPTLAMRLKHEGANAVRLVSRFPLEGWEDILDQARQGVVEFDGGALLITPTPAMTVIDIDGTLGAKALALAAIPAVAAAIRLLDLGGSIGIDFPTLPARAERREIDEALAAALRHWPHERTAMNGFGFVQLVARLERPSLLQRCAFEPAGAAARLLLRRAERVADPGILLLSAPSAVRAAVRPEWEAELVRRTGRIVRWREDSALAFEGSFAQAIPL